jgi:hypothetical protein
MVMGGARAVAWLVPIIIASVFVGCIRANPNRILTPTLKRHQSWLLCNFVLFVATCIMSMWATVYNVNDKVSAVSHFFLFS